MTFVPTVPCPTCQRRLIVRFETDGSGRVVEHVAPCPACAPKPKKRRAWALRVDVERRRAGICQRCPMPVTGKPKVALYCDRCRKDAQAEARARHQAKVGNKHGRAYYYRHREKILERERRRYQENPAERERRNAYKREWRRRNRDKVRMQKRRAALRRGGKTPEHIVRWRKQVEAGLRVPNRARRNERGERLCLTPGCQSVMHGMAKKCEACKRAEAQAADHLSRAA